MKKPKRFLWWLWDPEAIETEEGFFEWLRKAPWSIWFGRFFALIYSIIIAFKIIFALTASAVFPLPVVYILGALVFGFNLFCFNIFAPYITKKLFSEGLTDETVVLKVEGEDRVFRVKYDGKTVKVTWPVRLLIYFLSLSVLCVSIGTASLALKSITPTITGFGISGMAGLSLGSVIGIFAPIAAIFVLCYMALALKDVSELLSRENCSQYLKDKCRSALGLDAKGDPKEQAQYKHRKWIMLAIATAFLALAILGTLTTATIGLEVFTHAFPKALVEMGMASSKPNLAILNPFLIAFAVAGMVPFLCKAVYQLVELLFKGYDESAKLYKDFVKKDQNRLTAAWHTFKHITGKALHSIAFYIGLTGMVHAFCQGFIASLKFTRLPDPDVPDSGKGLDDLSAEKQANAGARIAGASVKYVAVGAKTADNWEANKHMKLTDTLMITTNPPTDLKQPYLISYRKNGILTPFNDILKANHKEIVNGHIVSTKPAYANNSPKLPPFKQTPPPSPLSEGVKMQTL